MTRIGLVGCGRWGRLILEDLRRLACEVVVAEVDGAARERVATGCPGVGLVATARDLPTDLAGYVVATPVEVHGVAVRALIDRRRPIFVEKPLCVDPDEARALASLGNGLVHMMHKWRYHPGVDRLSREVAGGTWGRLRHLATRRVDRSSPQPGDLDLVLLPHDLSIVIHILGGLPAPRSAVVERDGQGRVIGMVATLGADPSVEIEVGIGRPGRERSVRAVCERATLVLPSAEADHLLVVTEDPDRADGTRDCRLDCPGEAPLLAELRAFVDHCRGGPPPLSPVGEGAAVVAMVADLRRLARHRAG